MGICISTVVTTESVRQEQPLTLPAVEPKSVQEIVQEQPKRKKDFGADDSPLPAAVCCLCCADPALCDLCCGCNCGDCACCYWCLSCECCLECDECCAQCIGNCV